MMYVDYVLNGYSVKVDCKSVNVDDIKGLVNDKIRPTKCGNVLPGLPKNTFMKVHLDNSIGTKTEYVLGTTISSKDIRVSQLRKAFNGIVRAYYDLADKLDVCSIDTGYIQLYDYDGNGYGLDFVYVGDYDKSVFHFGYDYSTLSVEGIDIADTGIEDYDGLEGKLRKYITKVIIHYVEEFIVALLSIVCSTDISMVYLLPNGANFNTTQNNKETIIGVRKGTKHYYDDDEAESEKGITVVLAL